ncbi:hypothetical protein Tco_1059579, partial [Tanacetum coccineum]
MASTPPSMAWTTASTIYEQVGVSDDEESENDHLPNADMRKD